MDVTELRIGNFIKNDLGEPSQVRTLGKNTIEVLFGETGWVTCFRPEPIKLTEEWLFKFNWKYQDRDVNRSDKVKERFYISPYFGKYREYWFELQINTLFNHSFLWLTWDIGGGRNHIHLPEGHKMEYVHQLQNLFFTLSGTEMQLKERGEKV